MYRIRLKSSVKSSLLTVILPSRESYYYEFLLFFNSEPSVRTILSAIQSGIKRIVERLQSKWIEKQIHGFFLVRSLHHLALQFKTQWRIDKYSCVISGAGSIYHLLLSRETQIQHKIYFFHAYYILKSRAYKGESYVKIYKNNHWKYQKRLTLAQKQMIKAKTRLLKNILL